MVVYCFLLLLRLRTLLSQVYVNYRVGCGICFLLLLFAAVAPLQVLYAHQPDLSWDLSQNDVLNSNEYRMVEGRNENTLRDWDFWDDSRAATQDSGDSLRFGFIPALSYNSDTGLYMALDYQRFRYSGTVQPYSHFSRYVLSYRTSGSYTLYWSRDQVRTFGSSVRSWTDMYVSRNDGNYFPGSSFVYPFSKEQFDNGDYSFSNVLINLGTTVRVPLGQVRGLQRDDVKVGIRIVHEKPFDLNTDGWMYRERPLGWNGATYLLGELGWISEYRDSESRASQGSFYAFTLRAGVPGVSHSNVMLLNADIRLYARFRADKRVAGITLAQRFAVEHGIGAMPYWLQPTLGGSGGLRGYQWRRFVGQGYGLSMSEIRIFPFNLPWWGIQLGLNGFVDTGVIYGTDFTESLSRVTVGFAGIGSRVGSDFFLRWEMGFSPEGTGISLTSGYAF